MTRLQARIQAVRDLGEDTAPTAAPCKICNRVEFVCCSRATTTHGYDDPIDGKLVGVIEERPVCIMCCPEHGVAP